MQLCRELDQGDGVLVLTDLYGSTPSNIATRLLDTHNVLVISGTNVPMLMRILNYPDLYTRGAGEQGADRQRTTASLLTARKQAS